MNNLNLLTSTVGLNLCFSFALDLYLDDSLVPCEANKLARFEL